MTDTCQVGHTARSGNHSSLTSVGHMTHTGRMSEMREETELPTIVIPPLTLGWRLQMAMRQSGHSIEYMAARCGVSRSTISRWINDAGKRPPRRGDLQIFATECRVPESWLTECLGGGGPDHLTDQYFTPFLRLIDCGGAKSPPIRDWLRAS